MLKKAFVCCSAMKLSCRGYKVVVKFFPNEAANLEPVVDMMLNLEEQVIASHPVHVVSTM